MGVAQPCILTLPHIYPLRASVSPTVNEPGWLKVSPRWDPTGRLNSVTWGRTTGCWAASPCPLFSLTPQFTPFFSFRSLQGVPPCPVPSVVAVPACGVWGNLVCALSCQTRSSRSVRAEVENSARKQKVASHFHKILRPFEPNMHRLLILGAELANMRAAFGKK